MEKAVEELTPRVAVSLSVLAEVSRRHVIISCSAVYLICAIIINCAIAIINCAIAITRDLDDFDECAAAINFWTIRHQHVRRSAATPLAVALTE